MKPPLALLLASALLGSPPMASAEEIRPGVLRTPDSRFVDLPDFPFEPHYVQIDGMRVHYVDEGPRDAEPVVLIHGEPTWSYLFRDMIPVLVDAGYRVLAPDLIGFGRSDKYLDEAEYGYDKQVDFMREWLVRLDLREAIVLLGGPEVPREAYEAPFTDADPVTAGGEDSFMERVPSARRVTIRGARHFVQEDAGVPLARLMVDFMQGRPLPTEIEVDRGATP